MARCVLKLHTDWAPYLHRIRERELEIAFRDCPPDTFARGLELGAGDGYQSRILTRWIGQLMSTDYHQSVLPGEDTDRIHYQVCDAEAVGEAFEAEHFDLVFSSNLLEHVPDTARVLRGIHRVLRPDGLTIHVMPNPFWKLTTLALYLPHLLFTFVERVSTPGGIADIVARAQRYRTMSDDQYSARVSESATPKTHRTKKSLALHLLMPQPHGASSGHLEELRAFRRRRWTHEFERAGFDLITVYRGPVTSGYGFGWNALRGFLERLGVGSVSIFVAQKRNVASSHAQWFSRTNR